MLMFIASAPKVRARPSSGIALYVSGMVIGALLLAVLFLLPALFSRHSSVELRSLVVGASLAVPMLFVYAWIPWILDRYAPEPAWALAMATGWGAIAACGIAAFLNTGVHLVGDVVGGPAFGKIISSCVSAPFVEETLKGAFLLFMFRTMKREFDGVVDGVIYATFVALGFACVEDVIYYSRAMKDEVLANKENHLAFTFVLRGLLTPWGHPLYTAMTGIGFGIARETTKRWVKWAAPLAGLSAAMFLHCVWNSSATLSGFLVLVMLPLWFLFLFAFLGIVIYLVHRKGRIIRTHLQDEVMFGALTPWELELVTSPVGRMKASFSMGGRAGRAFVDAATRLALCKWHAVRAAQGSQETASLQMIVPLRQELARLRAEAWFAKNPKVTPRAR